MFDLKFRPAYHKKFTSEHSDTRLTRCGEAKFWTIYMHHRKAYALNVPELDHRLGIVSPGVKLLLVRFFAEIFSQFCTGDDAVFRKIVLHVNSS